MNNLRTILYSPKFTSINFLILTIVAGAMSLYLLNAVNTVISELDDQSATLYQGAQKR